MSGYKVQPVNETGSYASLQIGNIPVNSGSSNDTHIGMGISHFTNLTQINAMATGSWEGMGAGWIIEGYIDVDSTAYQGQLVAQYRNVQNNMMWKPISSDTLDVHANYASYNKKGILLKTTDGGNYGPILIHGFYYTNVMEDQYDTTTTNYLYNPTTPNTGGYPLYPCYFKDGAVSTKTVAAQGGSGPEVQIGYLWRDPGSTGGDSLYTNTNAVIYFWPNP
jgi:hypothetical protein